MSGELIMVVDDNPVNLKLVCALLRRNGYEVCTARDAEETVAVLRESEPGVFVMGAESSPFPLAVKISVPAPGSLVYVWSFGAPGGEIVERDRAELTLSS